MDENVYKRKQKKIMGEKRKGRKKQNDPLQGHIHVLGLPLYILQIVGWKDGLIQ